jgi:hypothetical protein
MGRVAGNSCRWKGDSRSKGGGRRRKEEEEYLMKSKQA